MLTIYAIQNKTTCKRYIGQTKDFAKRKCSHLWELRHNRHSNHKLQHDVNKYGLNNFEFLELISNATISNADKLEIFFIIKFGFYNLSSGGHGNKKQHHSSIEKLSRLKQTLTDEEVYYIKYIADCNGAGSASKFAKIFGLSRGGICAIKQRAFKHIISTCFDPAEIKHLIEEKHTKLKTLRFKSPRVELCPEEVYYIRFIADLSIRGTSVRLSKLIGVGRSSITWTSTGKHHSNVISTTFTKEHVLKFMRNKYGI